MVYLPSRDILISWQNEAKRAGCSMSEYIYELVERARSPSPRRSHPSDLAQKYAELETINRKLEQDNRLLALNLQATEAEAYKLRYGNFGEVDSLENGHYDSTMIGILRRGKTLSPPEILAALGIDPRDSQAMKLVSNQLEELRRFGLVKETPAGWRWV